MASPQKENGYTPIANEILEALCQTPLSGYESRVLFAIFRKTYGFHKKSDVIANSQFIEMTKIKKQHFSRTKKTLLDRKIVTRIGNFINFNKNYEDWLDKDKVTNLGIRVTRNGYKKLPEMVDTKDNKDTYTKEIAKTSFALKVKNKNMRTYNENESYQEPVIDADTLEYTQTKKPTKKYPNALTVFQIFKQINGGFPLNWKINKTQLQSAENLFTERGSEQIIKALNFYKENKQDEFCPVINSPYDLDSKWAKLISYKKRK